MSREENAALTILEHSISCILGVYGLLFLTGSCLSPLHILVCFLLLYIVALLTLDSSPCCESLVELSTSLMLKDGILYKTILPHIFAGLFFRMTTALCILYFLRIVTLAPGRLVVSG